MSEFPDVVDEALESNLDYSSHVVKNLKVKRAPISVSSAEAASILMGKCNMSQRGYKNLKKILSNNNIMLPSYDVVRGFCSNIDVGEIKRIHESAECNCMGYQTNVSSILQQIVQSKLLEKFSFLDPVRQYELAEFLLSENSELYSSFDPKRRTIILRETGFYKFYVLISFCLNL